MSAFLSMLRFNKVTVVLMMIEICLALAVAVNALSLIDVHLRAMNIEPGVAVDELAWVQAGGAGQRDMDKDVLANMRNLKGVKGAVKINAVPLGGEGLVVPFRIDDGNPSRALDSVAAYLGTEGTLYVLGSKLVAGRDFLPEEYVDFDPLNGDPPPRVVVVTRAFAETGWPGGNPLGKTLLLSGKRLQVVGVIDALVAPSFRNVASSQLSVILPVRRVVSRIYALRIDHGAQNEVLRSLPGLLSALNRNVVIYGITAFEDARDAYFKNDRALVWLLLSVMVILLVITGLGIAGLSSFWVFRRTRSIGIRRALGATRGDIVRYFVSENFIISTFGVMLGVIAALGANVWLMSHYEVPRLSSVYIVLGVVLLLGIGVCAALGPALRASMIPPMAAVRHG